MSNKPPIRIIKHGQRQSAQGSTETREQGANDVRQNAREMSGNVAAWVKEFKERRPIDPRQAFARLFAEPASSLQRLA